jgi:hypothetical protein
MLLPTWVVVVPALNATISRSLIIAAAAIPILFGSLHLLLRNKRWDSTERLVQHWLDLNSAAMSSTQKPCSVKITEFSPNGCGRRLETLSELLDRYLSIL